MPSAESLERDHEIARAARALLEKRIFTLIVQWFSETSTTVRREAKSRDVFAPYAKQLHDITRQQTLFREESRSRRERYQEEKRSAMEMAMMYKYNLLLTSYWDDANKILFQVVQLPHAVRVGIAMLEDHAKFRTEVLQEERHVRYQLALQFRVALKAAALTTVRGDLERNEQHFRDHVLVEWEVETIARYREFRLEDSIFQLERHIIAQSTIRQQETTEREELIISESQTFFQMLLSEDTLESFVEYHKMYLQGIVGADYVDTLFHEQMVINLKHLMHEEEESRLYKLLVDEGNAFYRAHDALQETYTAFRRDQAARRLQRWAVTIIAAQRVDDLSFRVGRLNEQRIAVEDEEQRMMVRNAKYLAMQDVLIPYLWSRLSIRERHERRRTQMAELLNPIARGFQVRSRVAVAYHEHSTRSALQRHEATNVAAATLQRIGRGCLAREEVCDMALEKSEDAYRALQHQHIAALAIQWAWKELLLRRGAEQAKIRAAELRVQTAAAIKIQALARRARVRDFYTLLLVPRHRNKTAAFLQRALRGAQVRRVMHHHKLAALVQRFMLSFSARRAVVEKRLTPYATTIQCMARSTAARKRFSKLNVARDARELHTAKNSYIVMIQALFKGYVVRKRNREAARIALQVRLTMLECDAASLENDMWCIGRGFVARRQLAALKARRLAQLSVVQAAMRAVQSQNRRLVMEELRVEELCRKITIVRVAAVQGILQQRMSSELVASMRSNRQERDKHVRTFQVLIQRCREGYRARSRVGQEFQRRCAAALRLHSAVRAYLSRMISGRELKVLRAEQLGRLHRASAACIQRAYRRHASKRRLAALLLQRSFVLRFWPRLVKRSEVTQERRKLHQLHRQSVQRYENASRLELQSNEQSLRTLISSNINTAAWGQARKQYLLSLPVVELPDALWMRVKRGRLALEESAISWLIDVKEQMRQEHEAALSAAHTRHINTLSLRCHRSERALRERMMCSQLECRRTISIAFLADIERLFAVKLNTLARAETSDRNMIVEEWQGEADVGLEKAYNALIGLLARSAVDFEIVKASRKVEERPQVKEEPPAAAPSSTSATTYQVSSSLRRKFALPQDADVPQSNISDDELERIFGNILTRASSTSVKLTSSSARGAATSLLPDFAPPRPASGSAAKAPRILPPLPSTSQLPLLQPQPQGPSESALAYDTHLLRERAKDEIVFTAEGIVNSSALGPGLSDETISVVETFLRTRIVTGLVLPRSTVTPRSILHLLRVARVSKSPLVIVDISQNEALDDVVGNHLVDLVDIIPTLTEVKVAGTSITPAKRLLLFHSLERKKLGDQPVEVGASSSRGATLAPVRFARQLQLPRRNGWATHFKDYEVETKAGAADRIFERLMNEKPDAPQW